jgi:hypothetical protein
MSEITTEDRRAMEQWVTDHLNQSLKDPASRIAMMLNTALSQGPYMMNAGRDPVVVHLAQAHGMHGPQIVTIIPKEFDKDKLTAALGKYGVAPDKVEKAINEIECYSIRVPEETMVNFLYRLGIFPSQVFAGFEGMSDHEIMEKVSNSSYLTWAVNHIPMIDLTHKLTPRVERARRGYDMAQVVPQADGSFVIERIDTHPEDELFIQSDGRFLDWPSDIQSVKVLKFKVAELQQMLGIGQEQPAAPSRVGP